MTNLNKDNIKKIFFTYFQPTYKGKLKDTNIILKILNELQKEPPPTSTLVIKKINSYTQNKIKLNVSNIKRIKKIAQKNGLIKTQKLNRKITKSKEKYLKILKVNIFNFPPYARGGQKAASINDRYSIDFKNPKGKTKIPEHLRGVQFYKTKNDAKKAIEEKQQFTEIFFKKADERFKKNLKIWKLY